MIDVNRLFDEVTERDLEEFLQAGEGQQIEFKEELRSILDFAKNVSALANAQGGVIIVGARTAKPQILSSGPNPRLDRMMDDLGKRLRPLPAIRMHRVNYRGVLVPVVVVKPHGAEIVVSDDGAFIRDDESNKPMSVAQIQAKLPPHSDPVTNEHLAKSISAMSEQIGLLRTELSIAQSLKGQWKVLLVGFLLGILASVIASFIYAALVPSGSTSSTVLQSLYKVAMPI